MSETPGARRLSAARFAFRIVKLGVSLIYFAIRFVWLQLPRVGKRDTAGTCVVLYYHGVPSRYRGRFERQMQVASRLAKLVDSRRMEGFSANRRTVAITFDDALESFLENAVPVLIRLKIPVTVFAVTDALGSKPKWGESYYSPDERVMSAEQLCNLPDLVTVGSHTLTHANLVTLDPNAAAQEIAASRRKLETLLHRPVTLFSFPFGVFNSSAIRQCREAGYERVFTTEHVLASAGQFVLGRVAANPWDWPLEFRLKIMGAYCWPAAARRAFRRVRKFFVASKADSNGVATVDPQST